MQYGDIGHWSAVADRPGYHKSTGTRTGDHRGTEIQLAAEQPWNRGGSEVDRWTPDAGLRVVGVSGGRDTPSPNVNITSSDTA